MGVLCNKNDLYNIPDRNAHKHNRDSIDLNKQIRNSPQNGEVAGEGVQMEGACLFCVNSFSAYQPLFPPKLGDNEWECYLD